MSTEFRNKKILYWISQVAGWCTYATLIGLLIQISGKQVDSQTFILNLSVIAGIGIAMSHLYRFCVLKFDWLKLTIGPIIPRVLIASIIFGVLSHFAQLVVSESLIGDLPLSHLTIITSASDLFQKVINWTVLFIVWSLFYFLVHFIQNYRLEEIKNLKWEAARNEIELNKLKSQLNPHFIFNSMNSIRALISENPEKAKDSVTRLSNILRNSLQQGKKKVIPFEEEMRLVDDYIELEQTRYEERLRYSADVAAASSQCLVPPMMIQTLIENAIKHGVSKLPSGGAIKLTTKVDGDKHTIVIENDGSLVNGTSDTGFGLENTRQRIALLYNDKATFNIAQEGDLVRATLELPKQIEV